MTKIYWDSIKKGDEITPLSKAPISKTQIAQFAGASEDYGPLHLDDEYAKAAGFGGVFAHGLMALGFADEALRQHADNIRITAISGTFQKLIWPGDTITARGKVTKVYKHNDEPRIDLELWAENQNSDIVMEGSATCILFENEKKETRSRTKVPSISSKSQTEIGATCKEVFSKAKEQPLA